ncbi:MAG: hypothetical protein K1000chlam3_01749 [Chlamydiae bacterium]|nr:hypothetical protein [Chlamydiota bacterium]
MAIDKIGTALHAAIETTGLNRHWKSDSQTWQQVEGNEKTYNHHVPTGNVYVQNSLNWALAKDFAAIYSAPYFYGAGAVRHMGKGLWEGVQKLQGIWGTYKQVKNEGGFNVKEYASNEIHHFKTIIPHFLQAAKYAAVGSVLWWDPTFFGIGGFGFGTVSTALIGYSLYNPMGFHTHLHKIDEWCRAEDTPVLTDNEIQSLSVKDWIKAITDSSLPLSRLWNMHCVGNMKETIDGEPKFTAIKKEPSLDEAETVLDNNNEEEKSEKLKKDE